MNIARALSLVALAAAAAAGVGAAVVVEARADTPVVANVLAVHGHWTLNGGGEITGSTDLPGGAVIQPQAGAKPDSSWKIILMLRGTGQLIGCKKYDGTCRLPIHLPQSAGGDPTMNLADNIAHAISISSDHRRFLPNHVRSALRGGAVLTERVVTLDGTKLDPNAFVAGAPAGTYKLRLRDIDPAHAPTDDIFVKFVWDQNHTAPVEVGELKPGVYEVQLFDGSGSYPRTDPAWLGIVAHGDYAAADARFTSVRTLVASWGPDADPFVVERFLRAGLEYVVDGDVTR